MEDEMRYPTLAAGLLIATASGASAQTPTLTIYTYDSFVSDWGPGPAVAEAFEAQCECRVNFVGTGDGAELLARIQLEGARSEADIVLGLDTNLTARAAETGAVRPARHRARPRPAGGLGRCTVPALRLGLFRLCLRHRTPA
jgi:thiamine transport system substrate-binding protein